MENANKCLISQSATVIQYFCLSNDLTMNYSLFHRFINIFKGSMGDSCQYLIGPDRQNPCLSNPCWNQGTCVNFATDFRCVCQPGYSGKDCRVLDSPLSCSSNPCQNNGICRPLISNGLHFNNYFIKVFILMILPRIKVISVRA